MVKRLRYRGPFSGLFIVTHEISQDSFTIMHQLKVNISDRPGQSNLVYKRLAITKASKVWFLYSHNCTLTSGTVFYSVSQLDCLVARQNFSLLPMADCETCSFDLARSSLQTPESCHIFGAIEGCNSEKERIRSAQETAKRPVSGNGTFSHKFLLLFVSVVFEK